MNDELNLLKSDSREADPQDVKPSFDDIDWKQSTSTLMRNHDNVNTANALPMAAPPKPPNLVTSNQMPYRRMSSGEGQSNSKNVDDLLVPFLTLPKCTDTTTPQTNMLMNLRGRLRSFVTLKSTKQELLPQPQMLEGIRTCKSYTDVNECDEGKLLKKKKASMETSADCEKMMGKSVQSQPAIHLPPAAERLGRRTTSPNQMIFHNLLSTATTTTNPTSLSSASTNANLIGEPFARTMFRSRAKSEANKREKIYQNNNL